LLFITIIIMMIKACYYQQVSILSRAALQSHAIVSSEDNDRYDSYSSKSLHHHQHHIRLSHHQRMPLSMLRYHAIIDYHCRQ